MMTVSDVDVCVVGGGPSGVLAAYVVARAGFSAVILDKKPRDKIGDKNCGDALDALFTDILEKEYQIAPPSIEAGEARDIITKVSIAAGTLDNKLTAHSPGYLVNRLVYGQRLLRLAEEQGVKIIPESSVRGLTVEDDFIRGVEYFNREGNKNQLRAKITIDSSGYIGTIRKSIPDSMKESDDYKFPDEVTIATYREIIKLKQDHPYHEEIILFYHPKIKPPGYVWVFSEGENMLNIGITWVKSDPYPDGETMKSLYHECLDPYIPPDSYTVVHKGGGNIPMRPSFDSLVFNGAMITGDAAGMADPTTFEGHGPALESGRIAGETAVSALKQEDFSKKALWDYNVRIKAYPSGMHTQSFLAAKMLREIGVENLGFLIRKGVISEHLLRSLFQEGDNELTMREMIGMVFRSFPKWNIMWMIRSYWKRIEKAEEVFEEYPKSPEDLDVWREFRNKALKIQF